MTSLGRILIVDDEAPVVDVLSEYFSSQGYAVATALSGSDALLAVTRDKPDLVLLDIRMPGIDGVEVLRHVASTAEKVPVIMVTANEDVSLARETLEIGAFDYVAKPFDFEYLDRAVMAGLMQRGGPAIKRNEVPARQEQADPWITFAATVFKVVRGMTPVSRASTGGRLEDLAIELVRHGRAGRREVVVQQLDQLQLLLGLAGELGDMSVTDRATIEATVGRLRAVLPRVD